MNVQRVLKEELLRSAGWIFLAFTGWSVPVTTTPMAATLFTVAGLPLLTWAGATVLMVGLRLRTGREFKSKPGSSVTDRSVAAGLFGFLALYVVLSGIAGWWVLGLYLVGIPAGVASRRWLTNHYPGSFGQTY